MTVLPTQDPPTPQAQPKGAGWRDAMRWLPGVVISLVALFLLFEFSGWNWAELARSWATFQWTTLAWLVGLTLVSLGIRALLWRTLLEERPSFAQSFFIINIGYMLNNLFPLRAGEVGRAVFMGRAAKLSPFHVLSTIVIERAFDLVMAAALVLVTLPMALGMDELRPAATLILAVVLSMLLVLFLMARNRSAVNQLATRLGQRWPLIQKWILPQINALLEGLQALTNPRRFLTVLVLEVLTWVCWVSIYYIGILAIAPTAPVWWGMFADSVLALGVAIPSAPAALGVYEASMVAALKILGIAYTPALAYAFLMHFIQFFTTALLGFWGLAREGRSLKNLWSEIRQAKTSNVE